MDTFSLQPSQLVCLELSHGNHQTMLYAEVIQLVVERAICWARPLVMLHVPGTAIAPGVDWMDVLKDADWIDLRDSPDLLLPISLFRAAFDTEVLPIITQLHATKPPEERDRQVHQQVRSFVQELCIAHPDAFGE